MNSNSTANSAGGVGNLARQFYLAWKALRDPSIPWAAKWLVPLAAVAYWLSPVDLIPFVPIDDIVVVLVALNFFVQSMARYQAAQQQGHNQAGGQSHQYSSHHTNQQRHDAAGDGGKTIETTWRIVEE